jgi:hypothetical protein
MRSSVSSARKRDTRRSGRGALELEQGEHVPLGNHVKIANKSLL